MSPTTIIETIAEILPHFQEIRNNHTNELTNIRLQLAEPPSTLMSSVKTNIFQPSLIRIDDQPANEEVYSAYPDTAQ